jgi:hypothetical protein
MRFLAVSLFGSFQRVSIFSSFSFPIFLAHQFYYHSRRSRISVSQQQSRKWGIKRDIFPILWYSEGKPITFFCQWRRKKRNKKSNLVNKRKKVCIVLLNLFSTAIG